MWPRLLAVLPPLTSRGWFGGVYLRLAAELRGPEGLPVPGSAASTAQSPPSFPAAKQDRGGPCPAPALALEALPPRGQDAPPTTRRPAGQAAAEQAVLRAAERAANPEALLSLHAGQVQHQSRQSAEAGPPRGTSPLVATCEYDTPGQRDPETGDVAPGQGPSPKRDPHPGREVDAPRDRRPGSAWFSRCPPHGHAPGSLLSTVGCLSAV
ncbi:unnamed protein product [Rangifer tarandus platyrhynchus]|uniref:Uncharacterized protein n=2 Tax=Rangifer tarandus platyrhynchus TaxID=3082113 RepID=A0ABN8ZQM4_RANTA|nr:unnamed protein product [Rangifer tarandus platyrhynchus]CAI9707067.1 unnamed protein product [Rangifer tarandus platyrhynchus]